MCNSKLTKCKCPISPTKNVLKITILHFNFPFHRISKGLFLLTSFYSPPSIYFFHAKKILRMDVFGDVQPTWTSFGQFFNNHKVFKVFNTWSRSSWVCYGTCNVLAMLKTLLTFILGPIIPIICSATNSI